MPLLKIWTLLGISLISARYVEGSQCHGRCDCIKISNRTSTGCLNKYKSHVNIILENDYVNVICKPTVPDDFRSVFPVFDFRRSANFSDSFKTMLKACYKSRNGHIRYQVDLVDLGNVTLGSHDLDPKYLQYVNVEWKGDKKQEGFITLEDSFLQSAQHLHTLMLHDSYLNLKFQNISSLKYLDLSSNGIEEIPPNTFDRLGNLESLILRRNNITHVTKESFSGLKNISTLDLSGNGIRNIDQRTFMDFNNMLRLNLSNNDLRTVVLEFSDVLENIDLSANPNLELSKLMPKPSLKVLNLTNCGLRNITSGLFGKANRLEILKLAHNRISSLSPNAFQHLKHLIELDVSYNELESLPKAALSSLTRLKVLSARNNKLRILEKNLFEDLHSLRQVDVGFNKITAIVGAIDYLQLDVLSLNDNEIIDFPQFSIFNTSLRHLDLSNNKISSISLESNIPKNSLQIDLSGNNIRDVSRSLVVNLTNNFVSCNCKKFKIETTSSLSRFQVGIKNNQVVCITPDVVCPLISVTMCPETCDCYYRQSDGAVVVDCSRRRLKTAPSLEKLSLRHQYNRTVVFLQDNLLTALDERALKGYENVTYLDVARNDISRFEWAPPNIEVLKLDNNRLQNIPERAIGVLKNITSLGEITLKDNPWSCKCDASSLQKYLIRFNNVKVKQSDVKCPEGDFLVYKKICETTQRSTPVLVIILPLLIAVAALVLAIYYRYKTNIKIFLFSKNWCLWCVAEEELDKEKTYDIFISYSNKDEDFVHEHLLPEFENVQNPFKVCIHYRDWVPGEFISKQIVSSVLGSRRTLVVLSNSFMESVWGKMEFRTAHTQAISEGRARVIVVIYGDIDEGGLDDEMKAYLQTNTYVKWGDPWFWSKLRYALPHNRRNMVEKSSCEKNLSRCLKLFTKTGCSSFRGGEMKKEDTRL